MKKKKSLSIIFILVCLLFVVLSIKIFNIYKNNSSFLFSSYQGFEIEGDTIVKYTTTGGNVVIPSTINGVVITKIGDYAFENLNITNVVIPDTITTIGDYAFANNNISSLNLPSSIEVIGEGAFIHNFIEKLVINSKINFGNACFNDNMLEIENAFFYKNNSNNSELISYGGKIKGNVEISNSNLTIIGEKAFLETYIVSISLPNSVKEIKSQAFKGNYLVELYLSNNIEKIEIDAFSDNLYLSDIIIDQKDNSILNYPWGAYDSNLYWLKK